MSQDRHVQLLLVPWCCRHKALLWYIAVVVTLLLASAVLEIRGLW